MGKLAATARWNNDPTMGTIAVTQGYAYNGIGGRPSRRDTATGSMTFSGLSFHHSQTYNDLGLVATIVYPCHPGGSVCTADGASVPYSYANGRLTDVGSGANVYASSIEYFPNGMMSSLTYGSGSAQAKDVWTLDPTGMERPLRIRSTNAATGAELWSSGDYAYDGSGNVTLIGVMTYGYDRFGRLSSSSSDTTRSGTGLFGSGALQFTGQERDRANVGGGTADLPDYMHARYYSAGAGRFLSFDPTWSSADFARPQSWNRYSYVENNPIGRADPDGRCSGAWSSLLGAAGTAGCAAEDAIRGAIQDVRNVRQAVEGMGPSASYAENVEGAMVVGLTAAKIGVGLIPAGGAEASTAEALENAELPELIYRGGGKNPGNLTPRPQDGGMLSARDSLSNPWPLPAGQKPPLPAGQPIQAIATGKLPKGIRSDGRKTARSCEHRPQRPRTNSERCDRQNHQGHIILRAK